MPTVHAPKIVRRVIVGTAGHIDHGKTTLVEKLTGIRTDRLPEEKERGMTLDVGYAEYRLPDDTEVGLIDVPGHEKLVRTMVAGATSMDLALLVIAADDGPMLQTREHVDILDLLGIRRAVVAITKVDLVPGEHVDLVEAEIREMLAGTTLASAPFLRVSSTTGEGIEALKAAIAAAIPPLDDRKDDVRAFRMSILRAFVAPGRGTVVTGIPEAGRIVDGDAVDVLPVGWKSRVRGIQVHHRDAKEARAGHRAALALADVQAPAIKRGMVVAAAGTLVPVPRFAARFRVLSRLAEPLRHGMSARVHVGADQMAARLHLLEGDTLAPGAVTAIELTGERPFLVAPGDRFVLRAENSSVTYGGGVVVERLLARLPRRREGIVQSILARAANLDDPRALILAAVKTAGDRGVDLADVALANVLRADVLPPYVTKLVDEKLLVRSARGRLFDLEGWAKARKKVVDAVMQLHKKDPGIPFLPLSSVRASLARFEPAAFDAVLDALLASGELKRTPEGGVAWKTHTGDMPAIERERGDKILAILAAAKASPPEESELGALAGLAIREAKRTLFLLEARKEVFHAGTYWFHGAWVADAQRALVALAKAKGGAFTASEAREKLGMTRKFIIPLLEALDDKGFTKRMGDTRSIR
jgi:selenocysteine-specific elongation factor